MNAINLPQPIVFIVDDNKQIHVYISKLMQSINLRVISYYCAKDFLENFQPSQPGCLLLDLRMPDMSGLELYEWMRIQDICLPVIMLTSYGDVATVKRALMGNIFDFIEKPFSQQYLLEQVQKAIKHDAVCRREKHKRQELQALLATLTPKEHEVLMKLVQGKPLKAIAGDLNIAYKTVDNHKTNIMRKMQVHNLVELVHIASFCRLLPPPYDLL
jgi:two-component system response regulator FixJ